jgi:hypothetical protein
MGEAEQEGEQVEEVELAPRLAVTGEPVEPAAQGPTDF